MTRRGYSVGQRSVGFDTRIDPGLALILFIPVAVGAVALAAAAVMFYTVVLLGIACHEIGRAVWRLAGRTRRAVAGR